MTLEIVLFGQQRYNPHVALARDLLTRYGIVFREVDVAADPALKAQIVDWVGQLLLPTLIVAAPGNTTPVAPPESLSAETSVRGCDRGTLISAPTNQQLENWLHKHGFLEKPYQR